MVNKLGQHLSLLAAWPLPLGNERDIIFLRAGTGLMRHPATALVYENFGKQSFGITGRIRGALRERLRKK